MLGIGSIVAGFLTKKALLWIAITVGPLLVYKACDMTLLKYYGQRAINQITEKDKAYLGRQKKKAAKTQRNDRKLIERSGDAKTFSEKVDHLKDVGVK